MKILNLYAGIGGNRKLWDSTGQHEITAIELNPDIAKIYKDFFPNDNIIIADAHEYLLKHYKEYDFIWSSPPCPTHSRTQFMSVLSNNYCCKNRKAVYIDLKLYQEIILLKSFAPLNCNWIIEYVIPYYKSLVEPTIQIHRHYFWSNFHINYKIFKDERKHHGFNGTDTVYGFDLNNYKIDNKRQILRNLVNPEIGLYILEQAMNIDNSKQKYLF